ncbi:MAG: TetR/AcrR family transcriptional regulator [Acidobacteriota bacterium]|nr:TetR/AcrR family transcriptional regulator [Acidobacteriota bacterium]
MPKLQREAIERNQVRIQDAALRIFTRQGYHGTSVREIADAAGVSLGNIYNYYPSKEEIYDGLVRRYGQRMAGLQAEKVAPLVGSFAPDNLTRLAAVMREIVAENSDFWRLMYIDVVEFGNRHFSHIFQAVPENLRRMNPGAFAAGEGKEVDFAAIYLQFVTYFLIETLFGGKQHLGIPDEEAIARMIRLATAGLGMDATDASLQTGGTYDAKDSAKPAVRAGDAVAGRNGKRANGNHGPDSGRRDGSGGSVHPRSEDHSHRRGR